MAGEALPLPIDIAWKRLAVSTDMVTPSINDDLRHLDWRSSIAVYYHEPAPPADDAAERTTFLKVVASITGYDHTPTIEGYPIGDPEFFPCYSAAIQVAVFPGGAGPEGRPWPLTSYPYFSDFEPKKRELVELVSQTGESLTQSNSALHVRKGTTTTDSTEAIDINKGFSFGQETSVGAKGMEFGQSTEGDFRREMGGQVKIGTDAEHFINTDASVEKRETVSFETNLSQLYQLLDSYHAGTNRALFMVHARPHMVDVPITFVNGPRRLEGMQEFFLIVRRPAAMPGLCMKAVLETAHLHQSDEELPPAPPSEPERQSETISCVLENPGTAFIQGTSSRPGRWSVQIPSGFTLDRSRGGTPVDIKFDRTNHVQSFVPPKGVDIAVHEYRNLTDTPPILTAYDQLVDIKANADNWYAPLGQDSSARLRFSVTVHSVKIDAAPMPLLKESQTSLFVLGREVTGCLGAEADAPTSSGPWLLYEKLLPSSVSANLVTAQHRAPGAVHGANAASQAVREALIASFGSPHRLSIGQAEFGTSAVEFRRLCRRVGFSRMAQLGRSIALLPALPTRLREALRKRAPELTLAGALAMRDDHVAAALGIPVVDFRRGLIPILTGLLQTNGERWERLPEAPCDD